MVGLLCPEPCTIFDYLFIHAFNLPHRGILFRVTGTGLHPSIHSCVSVQTQTSENTNEFETHREAEAANMFKVQWYGHPDPDVGTPLHRCGGDGEVL